MAVYTFETMTASQAINYTANDTLIFSSTSPNQLAASYTTGTGGAADSITLSNGTQSLAFTNAALQAAVTGNHVVFPDASSALVLGGDTTNDAGLTLSGTSVEAAFGFGGTDTITITGNAAHLADGGYGNDTIVATGTGTANAGAYVLEGGAGADSIQATGSGNYHIWGNSVANTNSADDGNDVINVGTGTNYVNGNAGNDTITAATLGTGVNRFLGGSGNDSITGGDGIDSINGNTGNDVLHGGLGDDYVRGGQGNDSVYGDAGNDYVFGDAGNDTIIGGSGADVMTGGSGNDLFVFGAADAAPVTINGTVFTDSITDFKANNDLDKIDLAAVTTTVGAHLVFASGATFTTEAAAQSYAQGQLAASTTDTTVAHDIVAIQVGSDTYLFSHEGAGGSTTIDSVIKLANSSVNTLANSDFV